MLMLQKIGIIEEKRVSTSRGIMFIPSFMKAHQIVHNFTKCNVIPSGHYNRLQTEFKVWYDS
jgi:hypothetical protein